MESLRTCSVYKTKHLPYITTKFRKPFAPTKNITQLLLLRENQNIIVKVAE